MIAEDSAPVSETWEEGTGAQAILILLDRASAPAPMKREDWKGLIDHGNEPPVAYIRLEDCAYPKLLERGRFLPAAEPQLDRAVECWLTAMLPPQPGIAPAEIEATVPDSWWRELVDQPGHIETTDAGAAQAFARQAGGHYQGVAWIGCTGRDAAVIRAELDYRLPQGRMLAVLAHLDRPLQLAPCRHSYLQVVGALPASEQPSPLGACYGPVFPAWLARELGADLDGATLLDSESGLYRLPSQPSAADGTRRRHLEILDSHFRHWKDSPDICRTLLAEVPGALEYGFVHDWTRGSALCRRAAFLLLADGRRREGIRLLHRLLLEAQERGDAETADEARHELSWLTGDDAPLRPATAGGEQLTLSLF